jgi:hypothetical protein
MTANDHLILNGRATPSADEDGAASLSLPHPAVWRTGVVKLPPGGQKGVNEPPLFRVEPVQVLAVEHRQDGCIVKPLLCQPRRQFNVGSSGSADQLPWPGVMVAGSR